MPSQTRSPSDGVNWSIGAVAWDTPANIVNDDGQYTFVNLAPGDGSDWHRSYDYGFSIPSDAVIDGVEWLGDVIVQIGSELYVYLSVDGTGQDGTGHSFAGSENGYKELGSPTDIWGVSPGLLTPAVVNDPDFSIFAQATEVSLSTFPTPSMDWNEVTIYYHIPVTGVKGGIGEFDPELTIKAWF